MKRPARIIRTIAIFLILGAIVNVLVAWGCAVFVDAVRTHGEVTRGQYTYEVKAHHAHYHLWYVLTWSKPGAAYYYYDESIDDEHYQAAIDADNAAIRSAWPYWARPLELYVESGTELWSRRVDARGWPTVSLWSDDEADRWFDDQMWRLKSSGSLDIGLEPWPRHVDEGPRQRVLPLRPIWRGIIINTLFYSLVLCLLFVTVMQSRLAVRRLRHRCPKCAYLLKGQTVPGCPECGWGRPGATDHPAAGG